MSVPGHVDESGQMQGQLLSSGPGQRAPFEHSHGVGQLSTSAPGQADPSSHSQGTGQVLSSAPGQADPSSHSHGGAGQEAKTPNGQYESS